MREAGPSVVNFEQCLPVPVPIGDRLSMTSLTLLVLLIGVSLSFAADYTYTWPLQFEAGFVTTPTANWTDASNGNFQYDWTLEVMKVTHSGGNSRECMRHYGVKTCALVFNTVGIFALFDNSCCLDTRGVGASPPSFMKNMTSCKPVLIDGVLSDCFVLPPHSYYAIHATPSRPAEFTFPNAAQSMVFVGQPYKRRSSFPAGTFDVPDGCEQHACSSLSLAGRPRP